MAQIRQRNDDARMQWHTTRLAVLRFGKRDVRAPQVEDVLSVRAKVEKWSDATEPRWRKENRVTIVSQGVERLRQIDQAMLVMKLLR